jgi:hypothetical protein
LWRYQPGLNGSAREILRKEIHALKIKQWISRPHLTFKPTHSDFKQYVTKTEKQIACMGQ